jgi:CRP-like cAMP-binding protein
MPQYRRGLNVLVFLAVLAVFLGLFRVATVGFLGSTAAWKITLLVLVPLFALQLGSLRKSGCSKGCCPEIFSELSEAGFNELMRLKILVQYERGDLIFQEGEYASGIYIICHGMVRVGKYYRGKRLTLELLKRGEILGMEALTDEGPTTRPEYAQAIEDTKVAFLEKAVFLAFLREHPAITAGLYQKALEKIVILQRKVVQLGLASADERVAGILLELGESCGKETRSGIAINVRLGRAELAELAGVSLETLIRSLSKLKQEGLIELHNQKGITICDAARLEELTVAELATS